MKLLLSATLAFAAAAPLFTISRVPMHDGTGLYANVYRPAVTKRIPAVLVRTPYGRGTSLLPGYEVFLDNGYAVVVQDVRGRGQSEGSFRGIEQEGPDGSETISWIARQPWSDGRVVMAGASYLGIAQWRAALSGNRSLKAIVPGVGGADEYLDRFYSRGGAVKLGHRLNWFASNMRQRGLLEPPFRSYIWHVPLRTADRAAAGRTINFWQNAMHRPTRDGWWKRQSTLEQIGRVQVPALIISGWYDNFAESELEAFAALSRLSNRNRIIVGPWGHDLSPRFDAVDFGDLARLPLRRVQLAWFDEKLGRAPASTALPVRIFVMGANRWRDEDAWPIARTRNTPMYLTSERKLAPVPRRSDATIQYTYDPMKPVPTLGGAVCCNRRNFPYGPMDQRPLEARRDVVVYTGPELEKDLEVTGAVRTVLYVSTDAPDTDFTAKLIDVYPDGRAINLCDGILRLRYRESLEKAVLGKSGEVYRITIPTGVTSNVFKAGHRIRVEISSSNFPRFDRNPNTGRSIADERQMRIAHQTLYHGRERPSHILLPVIP